MGNNFIALFLLEMLLFRHFPPPVFMVEIILSQPIATEINAVAVQKNLHSYLYTVFSVYSVLK